MSTGFFKVPKAKNEIVKSYRPGSPERKEVIETYQKMMSSFTEVPMYINGKDVKSKSKKNISPPHDHQKIVGEYYIAEPKHIDAAIDSALAAKENWENMSWENRSAIFLKAAELIDFLRFNVEYVTQIYSNQPESDNDAWNRVEYRPLEGFVYAVTPFNFTAIAGNLPTCMAMLGNVVLWKPSSTQIYSAKIIIDVLKEAGLPDGVINAVYGNASLITEKALCRKEFSGLHFTGSTSVFNSFWKTIGENISNYNAYPKIVGETGGKDFILAHKSANPKQVSTAITRGAFEFQGQKCSAASRGYISNSLWSEVKKYLQEDLESISMGSPENLENFVTSVIDEKSFDKISLYIKNAKLSSDAEVVIGGNFDKSKGYFIEPTVIITKDPDYVTMREEIFGPVMTIYVYSDDKFEETLRLIDKTSEYALTGAILASDRYIIEKATKVLKNSAGNFYINDKPTGAVVGKQPFGGARGSGTNDKAGSMLNLLRWVSPRLIKETFVTPTDYRYPFLEK